MASACCLLLLVTVSTAFAKCDAWAHVACRHDQGSIHLANDLAELLTELSLHQWQSLFGAWANVNAPLLTDPLPRPLRLLRAAPLPSILPHPRRPLAPQLQPGFTAAHALKRLVVRIFNELAGEHTTCLHCSQE